MAKREKKELEDNCKDCHGEITLTNMVMLKEDLWKTISDDTMDLLCDKCMERRMGRPISVKDFKNHSLGSSVIPCNEAWLLEKYKGRMKVPSRVCRVHFEVEFIGGNNDGKRQKLIAEIETDSPTEFMFISSKLHLLLANNLMAESNTPIMWLDIFDIEEKK